MKIGITCYPTYGGSGVVATELGKCLAKKGHEIHFISYSVPFRLVNDFSDLIFYHEVDVSSYPLFQYPPWSLSLASKMAEVITQEKLDVLHVHYAIPHATCAYLARELVRPSSIKIITTLHGTDITLVGQDPSFFPMTKFSIEHSDGVTAVSDYLKERTMRDFQVTCPIRVIPNFVETGLFNRQTGSCGCRRFAAPGEKIITHISNFRPVKRINDIIRVFAGIRGQVPAKLLMVGDGPDRYPAQLLASRLGIGSEVKFLGKQENVVDILSCSDLFLLPSQEESFGLAALEAMSCRVPVVAARAGGLPEVVVDGENGFLCPVGDIQALITAGLRILQDPQLLERFRTSARRRVESNFGCQAIVQRYEDYYTEILNA